MPKPSEPSTGRLYPPTEARVSGHLPVGDGHEIYWEESGNPTGIPVVFLHGGPGGIAAPGYRRFFDPASYRIVLFDQRGAGRSTPVASVEANTTRHLIADMEVLRAFLHVDRWLVFGGSWGATLALAYGQAHPERCLGFILRGVFLCRAQEIDWFLHGMGRFFPEAAEAFREALPPEERSDLLSHYYHRLTHPDPAVHGPAARIWAGYESACAHLLPDDGGTMGAAAMPTGGGVSSGTLALARLEAHYMINGGFLDEGQLLRDLPAIRHLPGWVVQGRYDMVCPIASAHALVEAWGNCGLTIIPDAGHAATEPGIRDALVDTTDRFREIVR